jgi:hypothetical protein
MEPTEVDATALRRSPVAKCRWTASGHLAVLRGQFRVFELACTSRAQ